jgi:hypothetical protein
VRNLKSLTLRQWGIAAAYVAGGVLFAVLLFTGLSRLLSTPAPQTAPDAADAPVVAATPAPPEKAVVEAQLAAAAPPPLASTIPQGSTLRGIFVSERNEAFVDLDPTIRSAHPGGTLQELMTVYTIVNALLTNLPTLQEVQILIGGQEVDTLAGHVDLRRPLRKNEGLILSSVTPSPPSQ